MRSRLFTNSSFILLSRDIYCVSLLFKYLKKKFFLFKLISEFSWIYSSSIYYFGSPHRGNLFTFTYDNKSSRIKFSIASSLVPFSVLIFNTSFWEWSSKQRSICFFGLLEILKDVLTLSELYILALLCEGDWKAVWKGLVSIKFAFEVVLKYYSVNLSFNALWISIESFLLI